jgi:hypothetical protein
MQLDQTLEYVSDDEIKRLTAKLRSGGTLSNQELDTVEKKIVPNLKLKDRLLIKAMMGIMRKKANEVN